MEMIIREITDDSKRSPYVTVTGTVTYGYFQFKIPEIWQIWE